MLKRSKVSLAVSLSCAASAVLAGGAMAHGGGHGSSAGLEVDVRGVVTELAAATPTTAGTITVSPGGTLAPWTCTLRDGADTTGVVVNTTIVKLTCRSRDGVLRAKRFRATEDAAGKVRVEATGLVTAFTAAGASTTTPTTPAIPATPATPGTLKLLEKPETPTTPADLATPADPGTTTGTPGSITVDPGTGLPAVTCFITGRTRVRTAPVVGTDTARIECTSRDDALVAKKIRVKGKDSGAQPGHRGRGGDDHHSGRGRH